jgi:hypothetical protein
MYISLESYLMGRARQWPLTDEQTANAHNLLARVNALLTDLGWSQTIVVSSGYRPASINGTIKGAAPKSYHTRCLAVDIHDPQQALGKLCASRPDLLRKHGLFLESLDSTRTWCHLDAGTRTDRPSRIFKP